MKKTLALVLALCMALTTLVAFADETYTYNSYMSSFPTTWNPFQYQTETDGTMVDYMSDGFYGFDFNEDFDGYVMVPRMAVDFPTDVTADYVGEQWGIAEGDTARAWKIQIREDLKWNDGTPINAHDFEWGAKMLLDPAAANYRADSLYTGNMVIVNAQGYVYSGKTIEYSENNTNAVRYTMDDLTLGADGVYTTPQGKPVYIAINAPLADWMSGNSLATYVGTYGDAYFGMENWDALLALANEDGYAPLTEESKGFLVSVIATNPAWGESEANVPDYLAYDYVNDTVEWDSVGFKAVSDYEFVIILEKPLEGFFLHYALGSSWLAKRDLYESLGNTTDGIYTNSYGTTVETSASYGPWVMTKYQTDKEIEFEKNPYWYGYALEENDGLYQTSHIHYEYVPEANTAMQLFLQGKLDNKGLNKDEMAIYSGSDYLQYSEGDSIFAMVFNPDLEALTTNQAAAGENINKTIITVKEFRMAMSFGMNRAAFCLAADPTNSPGFALYSGQIVADPENGVAYRATDEAKQVLLNFWNLADQVGEGKMYATADEAIDSLTGYNLEMAQEYFNRAYDIAIAEGLMDEDDVIQIIIGTPNLTSVAYNNGYDYIVNNYTEVVKGTKLEGKLTFTRDGTLGNGFSDALKNNQVDMLFFVGWTGSTFDPYGLMEAYTKESYQYDPSWDTTLAMLTVNHEGQDLTASVWDWTQAINGTEITAKDAAGNDVVLESMAVYHSLPILAALENCVLQNYDFIPLTGDNSASLKGMQIEYLLEDEVFPLGRGGIKYMTYNYSDAEWEAFVAEQGGELNYK